MTRLRNAAGSTSKSNQQNSAPLQTLSGAKVFTAAELDRFNAFFLDPGGAGRNVDFPAAAGIRNGIWFISNEADAAEDITVRNASAATICTISQNEVGFVFCNGSLIRGGIMGQT